MLERLKFRLERRGRLASVVLCLSCAVAVWSGAGRAPTLEATPVCGYVGEGSPVMFIVIYTLLLLGCSIVLSVVAFLAGRCGRRLPVDDALPRVVRSARFCDRSDCSRTVSGHPAPRWPHSA